MEHGDGYLSDRFVRNFFRAAAEEVGLYSLNMLLCNTGLPSEPGVNPSSHRFDQRALKASEYATLLQVMRDYYGSGARGCLTRIGHGIWRGLIRDTSLSQKGGLFTLRLIPVVARKFRVLEYLASQMQIAAGQITVDVSGKDLTFSDTASASALGQHANFPICWTTLGMVQSALLWAVEEEPEVEEVSCHAVSDGVCKFFIRVSEGKVP